MAAKNLYKEFQNSFKQDTGFDVKGNETLYMEYLKMKIAQEQVIYLAEFHKLLDDLNKKIK